MPVVLQYILIVNIFCHMQISLRQLARVTGYGSNHMRLALLHDVKRCVKTIEELVESEEVTAQFTPRRDKLTGDPIWTQA